jgi:two-component system, OmpR family, phosphate regulon sensor histidine kinase PhoR
MEISKAKILLVDDEPSVLLTVTEILRLECYEVHPVPDGESAIAAIREAHYDLVLTDLRMKGIDGLGVLAEVRKQSPNTVTVMMTGYASVDSALEALQLGAYDYLLKPVEVSALKLAVQRSLERKRFSEIDTLYHVSRGISHAHDPADIEAEITAAAQKVLHVKDAYLITATRDGKLQHDATPLAPVLDDPQVLGRLNCGEIVTSRSTAEDAASALPTSFVLVPGIINDRLACALCVENGTEPFEFHASAQRFLQGLASQAALALENATLISELRRNNENLANANRKLKELDVLKSQFLSIATHELRTPLSVILGYNSMLAESLQDRLSDDEQETLRESVQACKRLIRLVNSMLDVAQIESGKMRMNYGTADLRQVVHSISALFQHEAKAAGLMLHTIVPARLPKMQVDSERIEQVIINLLANALKFTAAPGDITVSLRHFADKNQVQISVSDTGVGIPTEEQALIFDEFARVRRSSANRQGQGSGLGLAIAKRIVEAHEGNISVNSVPGQGSTFTFTLPVRQRISTAVSA